VRILIVEDDFTSRRLLQALLTPFGAAEIAVDGEEAIRAVRFALREWRPYELVCLDIMMPKCDGQEALVAIRKLEQEAGLLDGEGAKVMMTSALSDRANILRAFRNQCETYLVKPIDKEKLLKAMQELGFAQPQQRFGT